jgi:hypothetical protein
MKNLLLILGLFLLLNTPAYALSNDELLHLSAHVGASYLLQTSFYGVNNRWLKLNKVDSEVLALATTLAIGLAYKLSEGANADSTSRAMKQNILGSALAVVTHITFNF